MNLSAIYSKTGKGVQEASGKTSNLSRGDRAVLSAIDGKTPLSEVQTKFEKLAGPKFEALIQQLDKDGFIREVSSGSLAATPGRPAAPAAKASAPPPPKATPQDDASDGLDFTQIMKAPSKPAAPAAKAPTMDLAAAARAESERKAKDQQHDYKARQEAEARAKAEAEAKARAAAEARAREAAQAAARAEAEAKSRAEADAKTRAEAEAKVKAAREAAVRMATEAKAKAEAEARAATEAAARDKARLEADLNAKLDAERKAREDAERRAAEAAEVARRELEEKSKREAEEMRKRLEEQMRAEMEAKLEAERKAREEEDRKRREEEDRRRKEEDERRAKEEAERRAREEEDRKRREEEERKRREEDERRRREEEERRAKEEAERKAREAEERKRREEEDRRRKEEDGRRAKEEAERKAKDEAERKSREDAERKAREDAERRAREEADRKAREEADRRAKEEAERKAREDADRRAKEDADRKAKEEAEAKARAAASASASLPAIEPVAPPPPPPAASSALGDDLLADLDSFGKREEEEQQAKEEADRKAKEEAQRKAKDEAERKAKEEAERKRREDEERRRKEEEARRAQEEAERRAREEAEREEREEEERKRAAKEAAAAKKEAERKARAAAAKPAGKGGADDDIEVGDEDLDMDDIKRDHKALSETARKAAKEREAPTVQMAAVRPKKWGKPAAIALFAVLVGGLGVLHVMPLSTADYEKAASEAIGAPVKIGSARLSLVTGIELKFENVSVGDKAKIRLVRGAPEVGSLFGARKAFSRVELEGISVAQDQLGDAVLGKIGAENFRVGRVVAKQVTLSGPLKLPALDIDAVVSGDGSLQSATLRGGDKLSIQLSPRGGDIGFEVSAGSLEVPFVPALTLLEFGMKGSANRSGITSSEFDGRAYDGVVSGTARVRWGASWTAEGEVRVRGVKVAVFAPALVSDGKVEGRGAYSMSGTSPGSLYEGARLQGDFKIEKGVLGSFDLTRALQTGGSQITGRTVFSELTGQGVYDRGAVQLSNIAIAAGAMNAGATVNIDHNGGLSGRVVAEVKTPNQTLRATLNLSGKVQDPVIRK